MGKRWVSLQKGLDLYGGNPLKLCPYCCEGFSLPPPSATRNAPRYLLYGFGATTNEATDNCADKPRVGHVLHDIPFRIIKLLRDKVGGPLNTGFLETFLRTTYCDTTNGSALDIRQSLRDSSANRSGVHTSCRHPPDGIRHPAKRCSTLCNRDTLEKAAGYPNFSSTNTGVEHDSRKRVGVGYLLASALFEALDILDTLLSALCDTDPVFERTCSISDGRCTLRTLQTTTCPSQTGCATRYKESTDATYTTADIYQTLRSRVILESLPRGTKKVFPKRLSGSHVGCAGPLKRLRAGGTNSTKTSPKSILDYAGDTRQPCCKRARGSAKGFTDSLGFWGGEARCGDDFKLAGERCCLFAGSLCLLCVP